MNDATHEQLSALMDGELRRDELRFLLRRIDADAELAQRWSRYQIASAVLKRQYATPRSGDAFVAGVLGRLEETPARRRPLAGRALRWAGGGAIAAAVAIFALVAVRPTANDGAGAAAASVTPATTVASAPAAPIGELHEPLLPQQVSPVGFADYAQPASYESIVPTYVPAPHGTAGQLVDGSARGFVPYVLVVGARQAQGQALPRREGSSQQQ